MDQLRGDQGDQGIIMDQLQVIIIITVMIIMDQLQQRRGIQNDPTTSKDHRLEESGGEERAPLVGIIPIAIQLLYFSKCPLSQPLNSAFLLDL